GTPGGRSRGPRAQRRRWWPAAPGASPRPVNAAPPVVPVAGLAVADAAPPELEPPLPVVSLVPSAEPPEEPPPLDAAVVLVVDSVPPDAVVVVCCGSKLVVLVVLVLEVVVVPPGAVVVVCPGIKLVVLVVLVLEVVVVWSGGVCARTLGAAMPSAATPRPLASTTALFCRGESMRRSSIA